MFRLVDAYLKTLEMVKALHSSFFIPAHAEAAAELSDLVQYNMDKVYEVAEKIVALCAQPLCFESLLQRLFAAYGLAMNFEQYVLVGSTVRSYLSWLKDSGRLRADFVDNLLLWSQV